MKRCGFSLLEVVVVVGIVATLAAIAIPRLSRGTTGAGESALTGSLGSFRDAIDRYMSEHDGQYPSSNKITEQLTQYTDLDGKPKGTSDATYRYGPYLRSIPPLPVGLKKGAVGIGKANQTNNPAYGWIYDEATGAIRANCDATELDSSGVAYSAY